MEIEFLERQYLAAERQESESANEGFCQLLLASDEPEMIDFHFQLLARRDNWDLYLDVRAAFELRGSVAESYLRQRITVEENPNLQGDALHLLGTLHSDKARHYARVFSQHSNPDHRKIAAYVLGWEGGPEDVPLLGELLLKDSNAEVRATAATAHDQLRLRLPGEKQAVLANLKRALWTEKDQNVIAWVVITIQYILNREFGMSENIEEAEYSGDVWLAKERTMMFLESRLF